MRGGTFIMLDVNEAEAVENALSGSICTIRSELRKRHKDPVLRLYLNSQLQSLLDVEERLAKLFEKPSPRLHSLMLDQADAR